MITNTYIGNLTELKVKTKLYELGYRIFQPLVDGDSADCIIVDKEGKCYKIQIKSSNITKTKKGISKIKFRTVSYNNNTYRKYTSNDIDYFCTIARDNIYLIPLKDCVKTTKTIDVDNNNYKII